MDLDKEKVLKTFRPRNIALAVIIGLGFSGFMMYNSLSTPEARQGFVNYLSNPSIPWLLAVFIVLLARDLGYMYRIRSITEKKLTWKGSYYTIILWEFASAITPSVVGGTLVAVFILSREGIKTGKAVAYAMLTAILDNTYFLIGAPIVLSITGWEIIPDFQPFLGIDRGVLITTFQISYSLIAFYTCFMIVGIFIIPKFFKIFLFWFVKTLRLPGRFRRRVAKFGGEIESASHELRGKSRGYWSRALLSTAFVWSARYFIVNCIFAAILANSSEYSDFSHRGIFSKQVIMWIAQLLSPTPGASGAAEGIFGAMFYGSIDGNLLVDGKFADNSLVNFLAFLWRFVTYYPYVILGAIFLPRWLKRVLLKTGEDIKSDVKIKKSTTSGK